MNHPGAARLGDLVREALYYKSHPVNKVLCTLCPKRCKIRNQGTGDCRVRLNVDGKLYTTNYDKIAAKSVDPVERVPLFHYHPGSLFFSAGTNGCTFTCTFCNEWQLSQKHVATETMSAKDLVELADANGTVGLAYRFNEPLVWYEYVLDCARAAREKGLKNVMITNGFIAEDAFREILPFFDAVTLDLKSMSETFFRQMCGGQMEPVLKNLRVAKELTWVEVSYLLIPKLNDTERSVEAVVEYVASVASDIPLHFLRFTPQYQLTHLPSTPDEALARALEIGRKSLKYVYADGLSNLDATSTPCPQCGAQVIARKGGVVQERRMKGNQCASCGAVIAGVFKI